MKQSKHNYPNVGEYDNYKIPEYDPSIPSEEREVLKKQAAEKLKELIKRTA